MTILPVSLIIPTRNRPLYLKKSLSSIFKQEKLPQELIVIDNSDLFYRKNVIKLIDDFKLKINKKVNLRIFFLNKSGSSYARNFGLKKAVYPYVVFLDDDCMAGENFIFVIYKYLSKFRSSLLMCHIKIANKKNLIAQMDHFLVNTMFEQAVDPRKTTRFYLLDTKAFGFKKELINKHRLKFDQRFNSYSVYEDIDFGKQALLRGIKILKTRDCFVYHYYCNSLLKLIKRNFQRGQAVFHYQKKWERQNRKIKKILTKLKQNVSFKKKIKETQQSQYFIGSQKYNEGFQILMYDKSLAKRIYIIIILKMVILVNQIGILFELFFHELKRLKQ